MVPVPSPSIFDPPNIVIYIIRWMRDNLPTIVQTLGLGALKLIARNVLKKIAKKRYKNKVLDSADPATQLSSEELNEIVNLVKEEILIELQKRQMTVKEEEIMSEIYRALIDLIRFQVVTLNKVYRNRNDIQMVTKHLEKLEKELSAHTEFIQMLFDGDIEINNLILHTMEEVEALKLAFDDIKKMIIEQKIDWQTALQSLEKRLSSIQEEILNELWNRFLSYQLQLNPPRVTTKSLSYFGRNLIWIMLLNRQSGVIIYSYTTHENDDGEVEKITKTIQQKNELIPPILLAFNANMNELVLGDINYVETENSKIFFSPVDEKYGIIAGFKKIADEESIKLILKGMSNRIKIEIIPKFLPNESLDPINSEERMQAINKIVDEYMYQESFGEEIVDYYKNNIESFIELIIEDMTTNKLHVCIKLIDIPKGIEKVTIYLDNPISTLSGEQYRITPSILEFRGVNTRCVYISRINDSMLKTDTLAFPLQVEFNNERILTPTFEKELQIKIDSRGKIVVLSKAIDTYSINDIKEDGEIITDRAIKLNLKNVGNEKIDLTSELLNVDDYTDPNNIIGTSVMPIKAIKIERIIPEPISIEPEQEIQVELKLKTLKTLNTIRILFLKVYSIMEEKNFQVIRLQLKEKYN